MATPLTLASLAVFDAIQDLVSEGVVGSWTNQNYVEDSQNLRAIRRGASLMTTWPPIMEPWLDDEQAAFLGRIVTVSEQSREAFATLAWIEADSVYADLGWALEGHDPFRLAQSLERLGFARVHATLGGPVQVRPTYQGVVRATKRVLTEWQRRLPTPARCRACWCSLDGLGIRKPLLDELSAGRLALGQQSIELRAAANPT